MNEHEEKRLALLQEIQAALSGVPSAPVIPQVPGVPSDAPQYLKDSARAALVNKPAHHRTADETAYLAAVADAAVYATMSKPIDQVTAQERSELLRQIRDCELRGWR